MFDFFKRTWMVPAGTKNDSEVLDLFEKMGIRPETYEIYKSFGGAELYYGRVYTFNCVPVLYWGLKQAVKKGNGGVPIEWQPID